MIHYLTSVNMGLEIEITALQSCCCHTKLPSVLLQAGIVHLQWEESSSVVSTCSLDGALRLWDARSGNMVSEYRGHTAEILDFTINRYANDSSHFFKIKQLGLI